MIVNTSAAPICATEAATKEGARDDSDSETSKMMNTKSIQVYQTQMEFVSGGQSTPMKSYFSC